MNEAPSTGLSASLRSAGFQLGRLQTGTPARLDGGTINFGNMERQCGDAVPSPFSYMNRTVDNAVRANAVDPPPAQKLMVYVLHRTTNFFAFRLLLHPPLIK